MAKFVIPVCLLLLALVHTGYSLKCYACDSKMKTECGDPFVSEKIPFNQCPSPDNTNQETSCLKLITEAGSDTKIKRYCLVYPKGSKPCDYASSQTKDKIKECLDCTVDGCNAAGSISTSTYVIAATCVMAIANVFVRA